jgi:hypothetical protein
MRVGNVVKSVGLGTYKDIIKIKTAIAREIVRKKSNIALGRGTMIIAKIAITKKTIVKSLDFASGARKFKAPFGMPALFSLAKLFLKDNIL